MRGISSAASISIHAAVAAAAFLFGSTNAGRTSPGSAEPITNWVLPETVAATSGSGSGVPIPDTPHAPDFGSIPLPATVVESDAFTRPTVPPDWVPNARGVAGEAAGWSVAFGEAAPEILAGPLPVYPDLLRQAEIEGQVVLEARVDTSGRVDRASIAVVSATHPGFVEPARQALIATLFRPARVNGRPIPMLIRVPFAFSIRGGTGRAR